MSWHKSLLTDMSRNSKLGGLFSLGSRKNLAVYTAVEQACRDKTNFDSKVDDGKGRPNPSCDKNQGMHARTQVSQNKGGEEKTLLRGPV